MAAGPGSTKLYLSLVRDGPTYGPYVARRRPTDISIELEEGRLLDMSVRRGAGTEPVRVDVVRAIAPRVFETCPICGEPATTDEHVPPESMGGSVMTKTCSPCNNGLGTRVEADLTDWHDQVLTLPGFSGDALPGRRASSRILWRTTTDGKFVLVIDGNHDRGIGDLLQSGQLELDALLPDENRYRLGLLKQVYLAGYIDHGGPPPDCDGIRADLIAARDAPDRESVPPSRIALSLEVLRVDGESRSAPPLALAIAHIGDEHVGGVLLGGSVFVAARIDLSRATAPAMRRRVRVSMNVGEKADGVVRQAE